LKRLHVYIRGRVQGVFFRAETERTAKSHGLTGWVRNMADGRVEALFEGRDEDIDAMLKWCHSGPPAARVDEVLKEAEPYTGEFRNFSIRY
jgi:acylphosphatase